MWLSDFNGQIGRHIDEFHEVNGKNGAGQRNLEGKILLEFYLVNELYVSNTLFKKQEKNVTLKLEEN